MYSHVKHPRNIKIYCSGISPEFGGIGGGPENELQGKEKGKPVLEIKARVDQLVNIAKSSGGAAAKYTLEILTATGVYTENKWDLFKSFFSGRIEDGGMALIEALERSITEKVPYIILFSSGKSYQVVKLTEYESQVARYPEEINQNVTKGLIHLYQQGKGFRKETWENISVYCARRNWDSKILAGWTAEEGKILGNLYREKKEREEKNVQAILENFQRQRPDIDISQILTRNNLEKRPNGTIDMGKMLSLLQITNPLEVPEKLREFARNLKREGEKLLKEAHEDSKKLNQVKDLESLGIPTVPPFLRKKDFSSFTPEEAIKYIPLIGKVRSEEKDPRRKNEIEQVLIILSKVGAGYDKISYAAATNQKAKTADGHIKKNPKSTLSEIIENDEESRNQAKERLAGDTAISRSIIIQGSKTLEQYGLDNLSLSEIQRQYSALIKKESEGTLTDKEERIKAQLYSQIQANIRAAQVFKSYDRLLTEEDINEVIIDTNRFISDNPSENIDFDALRKISVLTDLESPPAEKSLYTLRPDDPLLKLENTSTYSFLYSGNDDSIYAKSDAEGYIYLTDKGGAPLLDIKLRPYQVPSVKEQITIMNGVGMSSLVPLLPELSSIIGGGYRVDGLDGNFSSGEMKRLLVALQKIALGDTPILGDIPTMIKSFQRVAREHGRLPEEYFTQVLMENGYLNDDGTPRVNAIRKALDIET